MIEDKINIYRFLIDGGVRAQALARTLEEAEMRVKRLFKSFKKFELVSQTFHHVVGGYVELPKLSKKPHKSVKIESEKEGIDSVAEAYGRDSRVKL